MMVVPSAALQLAFDAIDRGAVVPVVSIGRVGGA